MKFAYTRFPSKDPQKPWFSRPIVSVNLFHQKSTSVVALVDSGADRCLFDIEVAKDIGLNVEQGETEIAKTAKACWVYPQEWMDKWDAELTVSPNDIEENFISPLEQKEG